METKACFVVPALIHGARGCARDMGSRHRRPMACRLPVAATFVKDPVGVGFHAYTCLMPSLGLVELVGVANKNNCTSAKSTRRMPTESCPSSVC